MAAGKARAHGLESALRARDRDVDALQRLLEQARVGGHTVHLVFSCSVCQVSRSPFSCVVGVRCVAAAEPARCGQTLSASDAV